MNIRTTAILTILISFTIACKNSEKKEPQPLNKDSLSCSSRSRAGSIIGRQSIDTISKNEVEGIKANKNLSEDYKGMVKISGGIFEMGGDIPSGFEDMPKTALPQGDELPKHSVQVSNFWMDEHEVTNAQFKAFVDATGYITTAETPIDWEELKKQVPPGTPKPSEEDLLPGSLVFHYADKTASKNNLGNWWLFVKGANWRRPKGPGSSIEGLDNYPVVHVSWHDAVSLCQMGRKAFTYGSRIRVCHASWFRKPYVSLGK
jgi:sulfatase modifying factor 1